MALSLAELNSRLDALEAQVPLLRAEYEDPGDLMEAFAGLAEPIADVSGAHVGPVTARLADILDRHGLGG